MPENFEGKSEEYIYLDLPQVVKEKYRDNLTDEDLDEYAEFVE